MSWLSQNPDCVLCARSKRERDKKALHPPADSFLRVCKPTEGQGWVHLACAVFIPEISFSDAKRLRIVEGISTLPTHRWSTVRSNPPYVEPRVLSSPSAFVHANFATTQRCTLCNQIDGAVVRCSDCTAEYHISCAWSRGYKFGFEIQPVRPFRRFREPAVDTDARASATKTKAAKRELSASVSFNGVLGTMHPVVRCKEHEGSRRPLFDICETNEYGEVCAAPLPFPLTLSANGVLPFRTKRRRPSKCTATPTSRHQSRSRTRSFEKRGVSTTSSKRGTLQSRSTGTGRRIPRRPITVRIPSARTARRLSLHFSIRFHARGHSRVIGVILKVGRICRSPTATFTLTDSDSGHSLHTYFSSQPFLFFSFSFR
jgi:hypothetical protein